MSIRVIMHRKHLLGPGKNIKRGATQHGTTVTDRHPWMLLRSRSWTRLGNKRLYYIVVVIDYAVMGGEACQGEA